MRRNGKAPVRTLPQPDGTILVTRIGSGWVTVPRDVWDAFTAAVKNGDYDHRKET